MSGILHARAIRHFNILLSFASLDPLGNSLKFTPPHGTVTLTADYEAMSNLLRVRVADTGADRVKDGVTRSVLA